MEYEKVKSIIIDNDEMIKEFAKCKTKLEKAVSENILGSEFKDLGHEILDETNGFVIYRDVNDSVFMIDSAGYIYNTKCHAKRYLDSLIEKHNNFHINKFNKKKFKTETELSIPKLMFYEKDDYLYVKNKECNTLINQNKFISDRLDKFYYDMVIKVTSMGNYYRYANGNKNDMVSNALFKILRKGFKFDHNKSDKMFSYFTYIITNEFNETSKKQYKMTNELEVSLDSMLNGNTQDN